MYVSVSPWSPLSNLITNFISGENYSTCTSRSRSSNHADFIYICLQKCLHDNEQKTNWKLNGWHVLLVLTFRTNRCRSSCTIINHRCESLQLVVNRFGSFYNERKIIYIIETWSIDLAQRCRELPSVAQNRSQSTISK